MLSPLLAVEGLTKHFPVTVAVFPRRQIGWVKAVDGVDFAVSTGETLGVIGESGCGKTTTAKLILLQESPTSGAIRFDGEDIAGLGGPGLMRYRREVQVVFQDPYSSLNPRLSVADAVGEPLVVHHAAERGALGSRVVELLEMVGLPARLASRYPHQLSGGQRQRVSIARALALRPSLIVADEPTSALDVSVRAQILNLMRRLQDEHDLTYVFISHDLSIVRHMSTRVAVMYLGKIVEIADRDTRDRRLVELAGLEETFALDLDGEIVGARNETRGVLPDRTTAVHYLKFPVGTAGAARIRARVASPGAIAFLVRHPKLQARVPIPEPVIHALIEDLE